MAVDQDYEACERYFLKWSKEPVSKIIGLSLNDRQCRIVSNLYPRAEFLRWRVSDWDLNNQGRELTDLVVACNVFHYSPDPGRWFSNVLGCCKRFWIQDLLFRHRGENGLGPDGDKMRYTFGPDTRAGVFDLSMLGPALLDFHAYDAGSLDSGRLTLNFVACLRGTRK
jgi:hypothetical protein